MNLLSQNLIPGCHFLHSAVQDKRAALSHFSSRKKPIRERKLGVSLEEYSFSLGNPVVQEIYFGQE